ncbi:MAG TPA: MarP family serine protease [Solirubrobacteraceae bacterium]
MTAIDVGIIVLCVLLAAVGWRQGFLVGVLSLAGFAAGALLGSRLGTAIVSGGSHSPYAPLFGLIGAVFVGGLLAIAFEGFGYALRSRMPHGSLWHTLDGFLGAGLSTALALALAWLAGAVMLQTPGARELRSDIQRSSILKRLNDVLPPSGPLLNALARFDPFPAINGPQARVAPPARGTPRDPDVRAAAGSVVRVTGTACGLGIEGSGWVITRNVVVTNAHVIAGEDDTRVQIRGEGSRLEARAIAFDPENDIALLAVPELGGTPALKVAASAPSGRAAAILGFPRNGPYDARPARLAATEDVISQDAYGRGPVRRKIVTVRGNIRPGNSGGPVVDARGRVVGTVFASSRGGGPKRGYAVPNDIVVKLLRQARGTVSTGPCAA